MGEYILLLCVAFLLILFARLHYTHVNIEHSCVGELLRAEIGKEAQRRAATLSNGTGSVYEPKRIKLYISSIFSSSIEQQQQKLQQQGQQLQQQKLQQEDEQRLQQQEDKQKLQQDDQQQLQSQQQQQNQQQLHLQQQQQQDQQPQLQQEDQQQLQLQPQREQQQLLLQQQREQQHVGRRRSFVAILTNLWNHMFDDTEMFLFAYEKGFLFLKEATRKEHNIEQFVHTIPWHHLCFGNNTFLKIMYNLFIGYDTIMLNHFVKFNNYSGFLYSYAMDQIYLLNAVDPPLSPSSSFSEDGNDAAVNIIMQLTTLLVSIIAYVVLFLLVFFLLRQTQRNMLALMLNAHRASGMQFMKLLVKHLFENLMYIPIMYGTIGFMVEFFQDSKIALMIFALLWLTQLFLITCMKAPATKSFFPIIFHVNMCAMFYYILTYTAQGYHYLCYSCTFAITVYSMAYFWNREEFFFYYDLIVGNIVAATEDILLPQQAAQVLNIPLTQDGSTDFASQQEITEFVQTSTNEHTGQTNNRVPRFLVQVQPNTTTATQLELNVVNRIQSENSSVTQNTLSVRISVLPPVRRRRNAQNNPTTTHSANPQVNQHQTSQGEPSAAVLQEEASAVPGEEQENDTNIQPISLVDMNEEQ